MEGERAKPAKQRQSMGWLTTRLSPDVTGSRPGAREVFSPGTLMMGTQSTEVGKPQRWQVGIRRVGRR